MPLKRLATVRCADSARMAKRRRKNGKEVEQGTDNCPGFFIDYSGGDGSFDAALRV